MSPPSAGVRPGAAASRVGHSDAGHREEFAVVRNGGRVVAPGPAPARYNRVEAAKAAQHAAAAQAGGGELSPRVRRRANGNGAEADPPPSGAPPRRLDALAPAAELQPAAPPSAAAGADATAEFGVGERVERRDRGEDWKDGFITSLDPLEVTAKLDASGEGYSWDEVRKWRPNAENGQEKEKAPEEEKEREKSPPA